MKQMLPKYLNSKWSSYMSNVALARKKKVLENSLHDLSHKLK